MAKIATTVNYDPNKVIIDRGYGINDLKRYVQKIDNNIKIFKEAIAKEAAEKKRIRDMISVLKTDIKDARLFKKKGLQ